MTERVNNACLARTSPPGGKAGGMKRSKSAFSKELVRDGGDMASMIGTAEMSSHLRERRIRARVRS